MLYMHTYVPTYIYRHTDKENQSIYHFRDMPCGGTVNQNTMDAVNKTKAERETDRERERERERERDAAALLNITKPFLC